MGFSQMIPTYKEHRISVIYIITCLVNGKIYVGSATDFHNRWCGYRKYARPDIIDGRLIERAIKKHGFDNFVFDILEHVPDKSKLIKREQYWIDRLRPWDLSIGYNTQRIADSPIGIKRSIETRLKNSRAVVQIDTVTRQKLMEYPSIKTAATFIGSTMGAISSACTGDKRTAAGFFWCHKENYDNGDCMCRDKLIQPPKDSFYKKIKPIYQINEDGTVAKIWACKEDIRRETRFNIASIWKCCVGQGLTAYGFRWQFVTEPGIIEQIQSEREVEFQRLVAEHKRLIAA